MSAAAGSGSPPPAEPGSGRGEPAGPGSVPGDRPPPYSIVAFDCDSTLSAVEGIDELASDLAGPDRQRLLRLTDQAMSGELALEDVYARRLALVRPTRARLAEIGALYVARAQPHARELFAALRALGKRTVIVSGGLLAAVSALGRYLGLGAEDVFAVPVEHDEAGRYTGFDPAQALARAGGKPRLLRELARGGAAVALVGDGATDLEARPAVARFVAYGGVVARPSIMEAAAARCETADLAALVPLLLSADEIGALRRTPDHAALLEAAARYTALP